VKEPSALKRCGGQGDVLCGSLGTLSSFASRYKGEENEIQNSMLLASIGGCLLTRRASFLAFSSKKRALVTPDILEYIGEAFEQTLEIEGN
jgi:ATP-dependent NAD(P)H-hydrate dehydratase